MMKEDCVYHWNKKPRIITYTNPKMIKDNQELTILLKNSVQLCASDTLMQGLISRYGRNSFGVLCSVNHFQEILFNYELTGAKQLLQTFLDVKDCVEKLDKNILSKSLNCQKAFLQNINEVSEAFRFLSMIDYGEEYLKTTLSDEQRIFFKYIYAPLIDKYREKYFKLISSITPEEIRKSCIKAICLEVERFIDENEKIRINSLERAKIELEKTSVNKFSERQLKKSLENLINSFKVESIHTIVIHGVIRFTPEIMMLIEALDQCGITIVFLINYCSNMDEMYGIWKRAYSWVGVEFEFVKPLDLTIGREPGRSIAEITMGKRPNTRDSAKYKKYNSLTEFTDVEVRRVFSEAQQKNPKHPLANMQIQYYFVDSEKPNEILRNYFPEQFLEKPFMAYPIGQFIKGLFEMWDFEINSIRPKFSCLKDCVLVKIAHSRDDMFSVLNKVEVFFKNVDTLSEMKARIDILMEKISNKQRWREADYYLSFYDVTKEQVIALKDFISELNLIGISIFGTDSMKQVDYQQKFRQLIHEISIKAEEKGVQDNKETQLLRMLEESLQFNTTEQVRGGVKSLKDALMLYLQVKQNKSDAKWIVRGFDQLDGAPLIQNINVDSYEIAGLSMKKMTKTIDEVLPWPLKENLFLNASKHHLYLSQAKTILNDRNAYLRFYLFYVTFFSEKDLILSYIENENDEKQRPYFMLGMLGLVPVEVNEKGCDTVLKVQKMSSESLAKNNISDREKNIFSICAYKYFLFAVLNKGIIYKSDYHIRYFIETEETRRVSQDANYSDNEIDIILEQRMKQLYKEHPYFDEAELSDIRRFIVSHFLRKEETQDYIQKKRDFLIAQWKENETRYMHFKKTKSDVKSYLSNSNLMPSLSELPHRKVCQECCFSSFCLNNYYDKEVDV